MAAGKRRAKTDSCEEAEEQHRAATNGLIEARRQADSANAATILAYKQTGIAAWGSAIGLLTLFAAVAAAYFAKRAADHTEAGSLEAKRGANEAGRSADAAEAAIAEARRIGEAQVRCYLGITSASIEINHPGVTTVCITVKNAGQSPASSFRWGHRISLRAPSHHWRSKTEGIDPVRQARMFMVGEEYSVSDTDADLMMDHAVRDMITEAPVLFIQVRVVMEWRDVFNTHLRHDSLFYADVTAPWENPIKLLPWVGMAAAHGEDAGD